MATDLTGFMPEETGAEQLRVESFFKPNLALIDRVLATRQTMYNTNLDAMAKAKAKVDEVNALEGFDKEEWFKMQEDYDKQIEGIMSLYEGDLSKANAELYGFSTKVGKDFGIHGKATALNERALGYMMNKKELDKRLAEGKIERGQYWRLNEELERTKDVGIGTDPKAYNSWRKINPIDAVNFDDFAVKFLTTKESDLKASGYTRSYDSAGFYIWTNVNQDVITYDSVLKELGDAFRNAADRTGQLVDDFDYNIYKNQIKMTNEEYVTKYTAEANKKKSVVEQLKATPKTNEERIAQHKLLNQLQGKQTQATGILTANDVTAKNLIIEKYTESAEEYEAEAEKVKVLNNDELRSYYYQDYTNSQIRRLADPYAGSKSRDKISIQRDVQRDPMLELEIHRRKKQIDKEYEAVEPFVTIGEGVKLSNADQIKSMTKVLTDLNKEKKDIENRLNELNANFKKTQNPALMNEIQTLKSKLGTTVSRINTVSQAQFKIDNQMKQLGMTTNSEIVSNHLADFVKTLDVPTSKYSYFYPYWQNRKFNSNHYSLVAALNSEERKRLFKTDDIEQIKKMDIVDVNLHLHAHYKNANSEAFKRAVQWTSDNLHDEVYDIPYQTVGEDESGMDVKRTDILPFKALRDKVEQNSDKYIQKSNQGIVLTQQSEVFQTDPEKGNAPMVDFMRSLAPAFKNNPQSFKNSLGKQITLELAKTKYYKSDGKEAVADLRAVKPGDINIPKEPLDGVMYGQIPLRDAEGNLLYEKNRQNQLIPATTWFTPDNEAQWNSSISAMGLANMNSTITRVRNGITSQGKDKLLNLNDNERMQYFETDNNHYINHLSQVAAVEYVTTWQTAGAGRMGSGNKIFLPDGKGGHYAIARGYYDNGKWIPTAQYGLYGTSTNEKGELQIDMQARPLYKPHLGVAIGVMNPQSGLLFNSLNELGQAVQFTNSYQIKK
jgi:hypothetical protein